MSRNLRGGTLAQETGFLVALVVAEGLYPKEMNADTIGLGDLHADAEILVGNRAFCATAARTPCRRRR